MESKLFEIRCPLKVRSKKNNNIYDCNQLCVRVYAGSGGEAWCSRCKVAFGFGVESNNTVQRSIKVQKMENV